MNPFPEESVLGRIWEERCFVAGTWGEFVRTLWPGARLDFAEWVLWERTAFPFAKPDTVKQQMREFKEASDSLPPGTEMCDFCNEPAILGEWLCSAHKFVMEKVRDA